MVEAGRLAAPDRLGRAVLRALPDPVPVLGRDQPDRHPEHRPADPNGASLENFSKLFDRTEYVNWYWNTMLIALVAGALSMFISACAAYAYSRFRFRGRRLGLLGLLLIQMFPQFLAIVTLYLMFTTITDYYPRIGFNTPWSLIILYLGGALGVNTWLMKGFLDTIPKDLDESARVDGATHAQIFFGIILPLITPILAVTGLLGFIGYVNEFLIANVFLTDPASKTLAVGLFGLVAGERNKTSGCSRPGRCWPPSRRWCCSRSSSGSSSVG